MNGFRSLIGFYTHAGVLHSDAGEWENLKAVFHPGAYMFTTWTGKTPYLDFIAATQRAMDMGAFVVHRVHGTTTEINPASTRAVTKMKATISQRFVIDGCEVDAEADCRFCYFWSKNLETGNWGANLVRHWYEKDKLIPVDPSKVPRLDDEKLKGYPTGYRYLAYCQETALSVKVMMDMPGRIGEKNINGQMHDALYLQAKAWVDGENLQL
jgi:hypothetical protein